MQNSFCETRLISGNEESVEKERKGTQLDTLLRDGTRLVPHKENEHAPAAKIVLLHRAKCRLVSQIITRIYLAECTPQGDELIFRDCLYAPRNTWERNNRHCSIVCFLSCVIISNEICIVQVIRERKRESRYHHYYWL